CGRGRVYDYDEAWFAYW
nr:immunoglobulin heavy chain junction region [Mus musculus]